MSKKNHNTPSPKEGELKKEEEVIVEPEVSIEIPEEEIEPEVETPNPYRVFKTVYSGSYAVPVIIGDTKRYLKFANHTLRTKDPNEIEAVESMIAEDTDKAVQNRRILTEDEFLELTSPESMFLEIDGQQVHITEIREAVSVAKENGWKPTRKQKYILPPKSKISQGSRTASAGGI